MHKRDAHDGGEGVQLVLEEDLSKRHTALDAQLKEKRFQREKMRQSAAKTAGEASGYGQAMRLSSEFIAAVLVGCLIGWGFDILLGTKPWGLIVFLLLGFVAGVLNVLRSAGLMRDAAAFDNNKSAIFGKDDKDQQ